MFLKAKHATISLGLSFSKVTLSVWLLLASCGFVPRGLGERKGCILQHVSAVRCRLLRVWCLRSASDVSAPRPAFGGNACCWTPATNNHRGTLSPQYDGTISKKRALQGPRSAREASSETADAHDSRFTSGRSGALQPSPAELCCEKMPRRDSIGAASCCRDSRGGFNYFARLSDAFEP